MIQFLIFFWVFMIVLTQALEALQDRGLPHGNLHIGNILIRFSYHKLVAPLVLVHIPHICIFSVLAPQGWLCSRLHSHWFPPWCPVSSPFSGPRLERHHQPGLVGHVLLWPHPVWGEVQGGNLNRWRKMSFGRPLPTPTLDTLPPECPDIVSKFSSASALSPALWSSSQPVNQSNSKLIKIIYVDYFLSDDPNLMSRYQRLPCSPCSLPRQQNQNFLQFLHFCPGIDAPLTAPTSNNLKHF